MDPVGFLLNLLIFAVVIVIAVLIVRWVMTYLNADPEIRKIVFLLLLLILLIWLVGSLSVGWWAPVPWRK